MIKNYALTLLFFFCAFVSFGQSDIIISQYIETSSGTIPKGIEIFNVSGTAITFSVANNLEIFQGTNGGSCFGSPLVNINSGTLNVDEVWVIGTNNLTSYATTNGSNLSGVTPYTFTFNGDDALILSLGGVTQDMFGQCGTDPGSSWNANGVDTENNNLQIKNGICDGDNDGWTDPSIRFDEIVIGTDMTGFGNAPISCSSTNTTLDFTSTSSTLQEDGLFIDVCVSITNPSVANTTSVDITLDPSSTAINGTDYDDGAGTPGAITFPQTLTFPANSGVDQCFTIYISNDDLLVEGNETIVLNLINPIDGDSASLGTNIQHIVTIEDNEAPVIADVIITEIMYNTIGTDDEWIEICNTSGSAQVLNDYTIRVNGFTEFTFPSSGAVIAHGACITIAIGSDGDSFFNNLCPFTPDYGINVNIANTDNLVNNSASISLIASDGSTQIDSVQYDDNDSVATDGNGSSFHVIDDSLDNSDTDTNWQAVVDGGSPGTNSLVSPCSSLQPEINIEGDLGTFPNISNNDMTPSFLDNTLFSDRVLGTDQTKSFRIQNIGTADLTVSNLQIIGVNAGDFSLTLPSALPFIIPQNGIVVFEVTFAPSVAAERNATVRITNDDPTDSENIFQYAIRGNGICDASTNVLAPLTGPENTIVTVTGNDFGGSTTVTYGGVPIGYTLISATEIEVVIPANATTSNIEVTNNLGCVSSNLFTVISNVIGSCEGSDGTTPSELFISEVTDASTGGLSYIELYNGTGSTVNLNGYSIQFFNNGSAVQNGGLVALSNVDLLNGDTYTIAVSNGSTICSGISGSDSSFADQTGFGGINFPNGSDDHIRLYNNVTHIDSWGTYLSNIWADPLGIGAEGVAFTRNSTAANLPNTTFNLADWTYVDWTSCAENDYSNIGVFDFSTGLPPTVNSISNSTTSCNEVTVTVNASEGFVGGNTLVYTWFVFNPAQAGLGWQEITNGGIYTTVNTSPDLIISDAASVLDFQFYCQVRENDVSCYEASEAIQIILATATWESGAWNWNDGTLLNTIPTSSTNVILNEPYDTVLGDIRACNLIINATGSLFIQNGSFIEVENNIIANGPIDVQPQGSVVQINDLGTVSGSGLIQVTKSTAPMFEAYEYTYWSSPTVSPLISDALADGDVNRRFLYRAENYLDTTSESNNDNTTAPGPDDIDDDGNDWELVDGSDMMIPGRGYASTHDPFLFATAPSSLPRQFSYIFSGLFNNGVIPIPVYRNDSYSLDTNWNLVGNPYPCAIDVSAFFALNARALNPNGAIDGVIHFWSHDTDPDPNNNGSENINFNQSDYATINSVGSITSGNGTQNPNGFIPSGQGFFVSMANNAPATLDSGDIYTSDVIFNNSMRVTSGNNQFFRTTTIDNKIWLNMTSDNGVFSQILIGYVDGATSNFDGAYLDAPRNLSSGVSASLYSIISDSDKKFAIQGKSPADLSLDETIPLGFNTSIDEATLYTLSLAQTEGDFMSTNTIYIKDNLLNITADLTANPYTFTSETGEFNNRFEIVFTPASLSVIDTPLTANDLSITEQPDGTVAFSVGNGCSMISIKILDVLGREVYQLPASGSLEVYDLSKLSKATYIAQVTLSNGQVLHKKAIKQH